MDHGWEVRRGRMPRPVGRMPTLPGIEPLEARIAPAAILSPSTVVFTDADGDLVSVVFSKAVFTGTEAAQLALANQVFKFDTGAVAHGDTATPQQLRLIDFTKFPIVAATGSTVNGVALTLIATLAGQGNGLADLGAIRATGVSLGAVNIDGDLGQIDAGGSGLTIGVAGLSVFSLGQRGIATQIPVATPTVADPAPALVSTITGELTYLKVVTNVRDARVRVIDGKNSAGTITTAAKLGPLTIGGSLIGRTPVETASDDTGEIECDRGIGPITVGTLVAGSIYGGGGKNSGRISAGGAIAGIDLRGSLLGGAGQKSGSIMASGSITGAVKIGYDLAGGGGDTSGSIFTFGSIPSLTIGRDLVAGAGPSSGFVSAIGSIAKVIISGNLDATRVAAGTGSGGIFANGLPSVTLAGSLLGGTGPQSGSIESGRALGIVHLLGNVLGGSGDGSGSVIAQGSIGSVAITGSLLGGSGRQSGLLRSGLDPVQAGGTGAVTIGWRLYGGSGENSGAILSGGDLASVTLGSADSVGTDVLLGGGGLFSGAISARGKVGTIKITGHVHGGTGDRSGSLLDYERTDATGEHPGDFGTITLAGRLIGGDGPGSGSIFADGSIAVLTLAAFVPGPGAGSGAASTGNGLLSDGGIGKLKVTG